MFGTFSEQIQNNFRIVVGESMTTSMKQLATRLGCTVQQANRYRRKAEERYSTTLGSTDPTDARVTVFNPDEVALILSVAPQKEPEPIVTAEVVEPGTLVQTRQLEPSNSVPTQINHYTFLVFDTQAQETEIDDSRQRTATNFNQFRSALRNQIGRQGKADAIASVGDYVTSFEDELNTQLGKFQQPLQDTPAG